VGNNKLEALEGNNLVYGATRKVWD